ncbi:hypothetical protein JHK87_054431 [Glycine soja]|nr:hypothetical protein JHK87_054431 [Glycine soja]
MAARFMKTCVANQVKERLTELESCQSGAHVLLSNIYAKAGRWEDVNGTRKVMKHKRITKIIGHSSVEMMLEPQIGMGRYNKELKEAHDVNEKDGIYFGRMTSLNSSKNPAMHQ